MSTEVNDESVVPETASNSNNLVFASPIIIDVSGSPIPITNFSDYIRTILSTLGIDNTTGTNILNEMEQKFDDKNKYELVNNSQIQTSIQKLITSDQEINNLIQPGGELFIYKDAIKSTWDRTIATLGKLQGLVILKKISSNDCKPVIESLLAAIDKKISVVNEILEQNITQTGGNNINTFKNKYLKYKMKYLNLKNNM
jgi:hypothetical protein